jgi:hypothetical protein
MKRSFPAFSYFAAVSLLAAPAMAGISAPVQDENLAYTINWPSGLSLGEARLLSHQANDKWHFELVLDAGVPGFAISDHFRSTANSGLCSVEFERETLHGKRKTREKTAFDYQKGTARRVTLNGGGKSETAIAGCAHDALDFVFFARHELGQGKVPPPQKVFYGAQYQVKMEFSGAQNIVYSEKRAKADRVAVTLKGPKSGITFEVFFAQDAVRTPLLIKVPLTIGTVSAELVR